MNAVSNEGVDKEVKKYVKALSSVLRLGRADASTDHSSVLFDVDIATGKIKKGENVEAISIRALLYVHTWTH